MTAFAPRPRRTGPALLVAASLTVLLLAGCSGAPQPDSATGSPSTAAARDEEGGPGSTDIAWLHLATAMDDQALRILELAPHGGGDASLRRWAGTVADAYRTRLAALRGQLAEAGVPDDNPHEGHDMPGMVSSEEFDALRTAEGPRFDRLLRAALHEHLTHAEHLARSQQRAGTDPEVKKLAAGVERSSAAYRARMPAG